MERGSVEQSANNWRLTFRREGDGVTLLRCVTCDEAAVLPERVAGLPVTALGRRALSSGGGEGETLRLTGGPERGPWDNTRLRELSLPSTLRRVGDYALYNCRALKTLRLYDGVTFWGGAVLMNCLSLDTVEITAPAGDQGAAAYFAGELNRELDLSLRTPAGATVVRLIFPAYREVYEENCAAHHFDYTIQGMGYPFHHCFRQGKLDLPEFDGHWNRLRDAEEPAALRLAWWRLRYPERLSSQAERAYLDYLRSHGAEAAAWRVEERDAPGLRFLLRRVELGREALSRAAAAAREGRWPEGTAILLEELHRRFPAGDRGRFAL